MQGIFRIITLALIGFGAGFLFFLNMIFKKETIFSTIGCMIFTIGFVVSVMAEIVVIIIQIIIW